ncbi:hypothetical protein ACQR16_03330 [Bradyrhizobium oligotrophicum]|uniref:hypothetical protein n=1 Tax=Bradyrhizobium oligotrophicum TaxID=44255 RepID=UPI003EB9F3AD
MKNTAWRRAIWLIGATSSFVVVIIFVLLTHGTSRISQPDQVLQQYVLDLTERLIRPTFLSFFTVCLTGLLYEIIMKADDQIGLRQLITDSVRSALYGRADLPSETHTLSDRQNVIKEQLIDCAKDLHKRRLNQLDREKVLEIDEFGKVWDHLINNTFENGEPLRDFTIGSNALLRFQAYQFSNYYSNLFVRRGAFRSSQSKVKILILCDHDDSLPGAADRKAAISRELEGVVKRILERIAALNKMERELPPSEAYKRASYNENAIYEFRLVNSTHITPKEQPALERPFNVYGNLAISQSFVTAVDSHEIQPLPHLEVSFKAVDIADTRIAFDAVWARAALDVHKFSATMNSWNDFGSGELFKKWTEIRAG